MCQDDEAACPDLVDLHISQIHQQSSRTHVDVPSELQTTIGGKRILNAQQHMLSIALA